MIVHPDPEQAVALLSTNPDYRVLRRFQPRRWYCDASAAVSRIRVGLYVDVETTGLDTRRDRIIELAILPFEYDQAGHVFDVGAGMSFFDDPDMPIPPEITALTGITDEMVRGQRIDDVLVLCALQDTDLVIAHNADFDRRVLERREAAFAEKAWACSYREVEWTRFGASSSKLASILEGACREFYDAHRALDDCRVGLHVLATAVCDGRTALSYLLESSARVSVRMWAVEAPFSAKDRLKARGYRWCDGTTGRFKAWYRDVPEADVESEGWWLRENAGVYRPVAADIDALDRYSERAG